MYVFAMGVDYYLIYVIITVYKYNLIRVRNARATGNI